MSSGFCFMSRDDVLLAPTKYILLLDFGIGLELKGKENCHRLTDCCVSAVSHTARRETPRQVSGTWSYLRATPSPANAHSVSVQSAFPSEHSCKCLHELHTTTPQWDWRLRVDYTQQVIISQTWLIRKYFSLPSELFSADYLTMCFFVWENIF